MRVDGATDDEADALSDEGGQNAHLKKTGGVIYYIFGSVCMYVCMYVRYRRPHRQT